MIRSTIPIVTLRCHRNESRPWVRIRRNEHSNERHDHTIAASFLPRWIYQKCGLERDCGLWFETMYQRRGQSIALWQGARGSFRHPNDATTGTEQHRWLWWYRGNNGSCVCDNDFERDCEDCWLECSFAVSAVTATVNPSWIAKPANFVQFHVLDRDIDVTEMRIAFAFPHTNVREYPNASVQMQCWANSIG